MSAISERPQEGQGPAPSSSPHPPLRCDDPAELRRWVALLKTQTLDAIAAGEDSMKPRKKRFFSRAEQRRRLAEAERGLLKLLDAAERGLPSESIEAPGDG